MRHLLLCDIAVLDYLSRGVPSGRRDQRITTPRLLARTYVKPDYEVEWDVALESGTPIWARLVRETDAAL